MANTAYVDLHVLRHGHCLTVNCVAFSPDGQYLASGGDDRYLLMWNVKDGTLLYRLHFKSAVDSVIWHPVHPETVIVGCEDGSIHQMRGFSIDGHEKFDVRLGVKGPVHFLQYDADVSCLAAAVGPEVHITKEQDKDSYIGGLRLSSPPPLAAAASTSRDDVEERDTRLRVTGIHFSKKGRVVIVSYVAHGIIAWDLVKREQLWHIAPTEDAPLIASSALSPDCKQLMAYHLQKGLRRYAVTTYFAQPSRCKYEFDEQQTSRLSLQMSFLHGGKAIVCGTTTGKVCIWDIETGELYQKLPHDNDTVQAVAAHQTGAFSYIATGSSGTGQHTYIKIWRARNNERNEGTPPEGPMAEAFDVLTRNRIFIFSDDQRRAVLFTTTLLGIILVSWLLYNIGLSVPWKFVFVELLGLILGAWRSAVAAANWLFHYCGRALSFLWLQIKVSLGTVIMNIMEDPDVRRVLEF